MDSTGDIFGCNVHMDGQTIFLEESPILHMDPRSISDGSTAMFLDLVAYIIGTSTNFYWTSKSIFEL